MKPQAVQNKKYYNFDLIIVFTSSLHHFILNPLDCFFKLKKVKKMISFRDFYVHIKLDHIKQCSFLGIIVIYEKLFTLNISVQIDSLFQSNLKA